MLHIGNDAIRALLMKGRIGLEKESLRIDSRGYMAHTPHPFQGDSNIVRDFSENQTEINTPVAESAQQALELLVQYDRKIRDTIRRFDEPEYLWPFFACLFFRIAASESLAVLTFGKISRLHPLIHMRIYDPAPAAGACKDT